MSIRYADLDQDSNGTRDFIIRRRTPTLSQLLAIFSIIVILACVGIFLLPERSQALLFLIGLLAVSGWFIISVIQKNRDLVLATEFQNALFASALGINNKFCIIIRPDGNIVYLDQSFQQMFPDFLKQARRTVDVLLEHGKVSKEDSDKIFSAIEQGVFAKVVFAIRGAGNQHHKMIMSIEPIMRPSGFIMIRGREYVESRSTQGDSAGMMLNKSSITLFSHVMDAMNMGVYMSNPNGSLIYANPVLEQWLGYGDGEIISGSLSLQDIISHGGQRSDHIEPDNYEGEIMLQKKTGGLMKSFINQKLIHDEHGKVIGCTALVHNFIEQNSDAKKKLW